MKATLQSWSAREELDLSEILTSIKKVSSIPPLPNCLETSEADSKPSPEVLACQVIQSLLKASFTLLDTINFSRRIW